MGVILPLLSLMQGRSMMLQLLTPDNFMIFFLQKQIHQNHACILFRHMLYLRQQARESWLKNSPYVAIPLMEHTGPHTTDLDYTLCY